MAQSQAHIPPHISPHQHGQNHHYHHQHEHHADGNTPVIQSSDKSDFTPHSSTSQTLDPGKNPDAYMQTQRIEDNAVVKGVCSSSNEEGVAGGRVGKEGDNGEGERGRESEGVDGSDKKARWRCKARLYVHISIAAIFTA